MKKFLLALGLVAVMAMPAFAGVQNVKVSGNVTSVFLNRENFDLGFTGGGVPARNGDTVQNVFITQSLLGVEADLTDQVSATLRLINERAWDADTANTSDIDINLAYVTLREMLYSPLTVMIGRQQWAYGNSFIFNATGTNNTGPGDTGILDVATDLTNQTSLDAIRLQFDYNPLKVELVYAKLDAGGVQSVVDIVDDADFYGLDSTYELGDNWNSLVEAYFFTRFDRTLRGTSAVGKTDSIYLPGFRVSTNPIEGLNTQLELAWQRGTRAAGTNDIQKRRAMAGQFIAGYQIPMWEEYKPMAQYVYTYTSGDRDPDVVSSNNNFAASREVFTAWNPFFEAQAGGKIYNSLFDLTNSHIHIVSLQAVPLEDLTAKFTWTGLWLDRENRDGSFNIRQPNATATVPVLSTTDKSVGSEYDIDLTYAYTEDVSLGASFGWYNPGDALASTNDSTATQAIVSVGLNF